MKKTVNTAINLMLILGFGIIILLSLLLQGCATTSKTPLNQEQLCQYSQGHIAWNYAYNQYECMKADGSIELPDKLWVIK